ncbi:hypothetical protein BD779DRAFT_1482991 [Infundibulicybe gibba]|nr:hypothetical protein BD779DRAFT_1482991 [Infundibulicybe gibba]
MIMRYYLWGNEWVSVDGQWNVSDVMMFMKSVGDTSRRVNPTEVMFAAFSAYLYLNASWASFLLRSSLQQQASVLLASTYAMSDLGSSYPSALGNTPTASIEALAIESSGDMIIMALTHVIVSGDGSLVSRYHQLRWTNLTIKGIIGIRAMGEISQIVGQAYQ